MKIKCPGCSQLLTVPATAAGKVAKCGCGTQMRVPAASGSVAASRNQSSAAGASPRRQLAAMPTGAGGNSHGFDADLFDELTEGDLKPFAAPRSGFPETAVPAKSSSALNQYAPPDEVEGSSRPGSRPGFLTFIGVINGLWAAFYMLVALMAFGLMAAIPTLAENMQMPDGGGWLLGISAAILVFAAVLSVVTAVCCFVGKPLCWYVVLFAYAFAVGERAVNATEMVRAGSEPGKIAGAVVAILIGVAFLAALHGDPVRAFYRVRRVKGIKVAAPNLVGVLVGVGSACLPLFLL